MARWQAAANIICITSFCRRRRSTGAILATRCLEGYVAVYQMDGGFVAAERAVTSAAKLAMESGAVLRGHEPVLEVSPIAGGGVRVRTTRGTYEAGRLVMSPGAWVGELVPRLKEISVPERQVLGWFRPKQPELFRLGAFPVSNLKSDVGHFYQFPMWTIPGFKIGLYHHLRERGSADELSRVPTARDEEALREGVKRFFPRGQRRRAGAAHLHVHEHAGRALHSRLAAGLSRGDRRLPVLRPWLQVRERAIGEILADMATSQAAALRSRRRSSCARFGNA